jgi:serine protease Do
MWNNSITAIFAVALWSASLPGWGMDLAKLVEQNSSAVVNISGTPKDDDGSSKKTPEDDEDSPDSEEWGQSEARGSGFILSADGYVITNSHVVKNTSDVIVSLLDRREFPAKVVGMDELSDIALLKIEGESQLPVVKIGDSSKIKVGQWVLAIGSPFDFDYTATQGIISALGRSLEETYVPYIQMDAALNPGNSGGPLFNMDGEVIGVNAQIYTKNGSYMGLSFAIPIHLAMNVADQLKAKGKVARGWLGVVIQLVDANLAKSFGLTKPQGALVSKIMAGSPAQQAGIQVGDIILSYNGEPLDTHAELPTLVGMTEIGKTATLKVRRNNQEMEVPVLIAELSDDPNQLVGGTSPSKKRLKILVVELSAKDRDALELPSGGVLIKKVTDGPGSKAGLQNGDIILKLNHQDVQNLANFEQLVSQLPAKQPVPVLVQREDGTFFTTVQLSE